MKFFVIGCCVFFINLNVGLIRQDVRDIKECLIEQREAQERSEQ